MNFITEIKYFFRGKPNNEEIIKDNIDSIMSDFYLHDVSISDQTKIVKGLLEKIVTKRTMELDATLLKTESLKQEIALLKAITI